MKKKFLMLISLVAVCATSGCRWDSGNYDTYLVNDRVLSCEGSCINITKTITEEDCNNKADLLGSALYVCKKNNEPITEQDCIGSGLAWNQNSGCVTPTKDNCDKIEGAEWTYQQCLITNETQCKNDKVKGTWVKFNLIYLGNGRYAKQIQDEDDNIKYICGSYDEVMNNNGSDCEEKEALDYKSMFKHHLCSSEAPYCMSLAMDDDPIAMCTACMADNAIVCEPNGQCVNLMNDNNNCGECGHVCPVMTSCQNGSCVEIDCKRMGLVECNDKCVDINTVENCGGCGNADEDKCKLNGECNEHVCKEGYYCNDGNCLENDTCHENQLKCYCQITDDGLTNCSDSKIDNGEFVCIKPTDADTCGATSCSERGNHCPLGQGCINNNCACPEGTFKHDDKCLSPIDDSSCGATADSPGVVCKDTTGHCDPDSGICKLCKNGYVQCGKTDDTGKFIGNCIDPSTNDDFCGVSIDCEVTDKNICINNNMQCEEGKCKCPEGHAACGSHGECVSLTDSTVWNHHCGATDRGRCDQPEKQSSTEPGPDYMGIRCGVNQTCSENGECLCNGTWCDNECVMTLEVTINHCGACGNGHVLFGTEAGNLTGDCTVIDKERATCNNGKCACEGELELVKVRGSDNKFACIDPNTDADYCGSAHEQCEGKCENGTCAPLLCDSPLVNCKGRCVNLDDLNMVKCMECKPGYCVHNDPDVTLANGCLDIGQNDNNNCGTCGNVCPDKTTCNNGECKPEEGYLLCSGKIYNKSELKLKTCSSCADGFEDMDGNYLNGCEINLKTNKYNCGTRGYDCTKHLSNVIADSIACENGLCTFTSCSDIAHYADCNNDKSSNSNANRDGCDTDITTTANCGMCGKLCSDSQVCTNGTCCYQETEFDKKFKGTPVCCAGLTLYRYSYRADSFWVWNNCTHSSHYACFAEKPSDDDNNCWSLVE